MEIRKGNRGWELGPMSVDDADSSRAIPGIYTRCAADGRSFYVTGSLDAVRAVSLMMGGLSIMDPPDPKLPEFPLPNVELYPYQQVGIKQLANIIRVRGGAILADDMGLGKTRQAAAVACGLPGRKLVVCPASVRESWRRELERCGVLAADVAVLEPPSVKRNLLDWERATGTAWVVVSYELTERAIDQCFKQRYPSVLIIDEAHGIKGRKNPRSVKIEQLARQVPYRLALTGTPIWDRPRDFYQLLKVVAGGAFGTAFAFDQRYCGAVQNERGAWDTTGVSCSDELRLRLSYYMVRRERREVLSNLPRLRRDIRFVEGSHRARAVSEAFYLGQASITDALSAALESKFSAAVELATEAKKFLLFTWQKKHAHQLWQELNKNGVACNYITGDLDGTKRQEAIDDARARGIGIVATIDSCGTGVDGLQMVASVGIFHALDYVPQKHLQAEARLNRIGQALPVSWYYIVMKDTVEELVMKRNIEKLEAFTETVGIGDSAELAEAMSAQSASIEDELRSLYAAMPDEDDNG